MNVLARKPGSQRFPGIASVPAAAHAPDLHSGKDRAVPWVEEDAGDSRREGRAADALVRHPGVHAPHLADPRNRDCSADVQLRLVRLTLRGVGRLTRPSCYKYFTPRLSVPRYFHSIGRSQRRKCFATI